MIAFWLPFWIGLIIVGGVGAILTGCTGTTPVGRHRLNRALRAEELATVEAWLEQIRKTR